MMMLNMTARAVDDIKEFDAGTSAVDVESDVVGF
jgi:hypothetical protein